MQNAYNNYIKRQKQNATVNFKEKVANSLNGKALNTTTNKVNKTPMGYGVTTQNGGVAKLANPITTPPVEHKATVTQSAGSPKPVQLVEHKATLNQNAGAPRPVKSDSNAVQPTTQPINQVTTQNVPQTTTQAPVATPEGVAPATGEGAVGMMSQADINGVFNGQQTNTITSEDKAIVDELAKDPNIIGRAYSSKKTPQQMAQELLETQKEQLQKDWEQKQKELEEQKNQLQSSYDQSVKDAENAYNESVDDLNEQRYKQREEMNVSAVQRGIQYSPQQLGLENVANINHNKNLAQASKTRNELLNKLQIELGNAMANVNLGFQDSVNKYNSAVTNLYADYQNKLMDWAYNDEQTEEERKWQEEQAEADRKFQQQMQDAQNKWQSGENALDRKNSRSGGGYSGYSYGGSRSYSAYKPYSSSGSSYSARSMAELEDGLVNGDEDYENAYLKTFKDASETIMDELNIGTLHDVETKAEIYKEQFDGEINYLKSIGASQKVIDEVEATRDVALTNLYKKSYARSTNTPYQEGDTVYKPSTPVRQSYIDKTKSENGKRQYEYVKKNLTDNKGLPKKGNTETWFKAVNDRNALDIHNKIMSGAKTKTTTSKTKTLATSPLRDSSLRQELKTTKTKSNSNKSETKSKIAKNLSKAKTNAQKNTTKSTTAKTKQNVVKSVNNAKKNTAKAKTNVKKNVAKSVNNAKKNSFSKTFSKLKKNISKSLKKLFK